MRLGLALGVALGAASCAGGVIPPSVSLLEARQSTPVPVAPAATAPVVLATGSSARAHGVIAGPDIATLAIGSGAEAGARDAFRLSCPVLLRRPDPSGLARGEDWAMACRAAGSNGDARDFFRTHFETVQVGTGLAFATGYYEPEIAGSRTRDAAHSVPVFASPADLVEIDLGAFSESLKGRTVRGRMEKAAFVPYFDRGAIDQGALERLSVPIAWAADYVEFFFLQVQGSGRLRLPDGRVMRIGYAGQNGHDYTGIGALMRQRGLLSPGQASMQGIMAWLRANPAEGMAIMRANKSYVFFRELTGAGPVGSLGVAVASRTSVAADPAFVPLGAPVWLDLDRNEADGLWIAQDTGGAIKGANRFDTFWGAGDEARRIAGGMSGRGTAYILVPCGTLKRLGTPASVNGVAPAQR